MRKTNVACAKKWADCALVLHIKSFKMVFLKLVHMEYQVNHKTQLFWVKVVHLVPNVQILAGHAVGTIRLAPTTTLYFDTVHKPSIYSHN